MKVLFEFDPSLSPQLQAEFTPSMFQALSEFVIAQTPRPPAHVVLVLWNPPGYNFCCAPAAEIESIVALITSDPGRDQETAAWLRARLREPAAPPRRVLCLFKAGNAQGTALLLGAGGAA